MLHRRQETGFPLKCCTSTFKLDAPQTRGEGVRSGNIPTTHISWLLVFSFSFSTRFSFLSLLELPVCLLSNTLGPTPSPSLPSSQFILLWPLFTPVWPHPLAENRVECLSQDLLCFSLSPVSFLVNSLLLSMSSLA